jgi:hypothetical protein
MLDAFVLFLKQAYLSFFLRNGAVARPQFMPSCWPELKDYGRGGIINSFVSVAQTYQEFAIGPS